MEGNFGVLRLLQGVATLAKKITLAGATLALHHHKRTLHPVQLIFLGSNEHNTANGACGSVQRVSRN
jgi:hypothetical protein